MKKTEYFLLFILLFAVASCEKGEKEVLHSKERPVIQKDTFSDGTETENVSHNPMLDSLQNYFYSFFGLDSIQIVSKYGVPDSIKYFQDKLWSNDIDSVYHHIYYYNDITMYIINNKALLAVTIFKDINLSGGTIKIGMKSQDLIFMLGQPKEEGYDDYDHDYIVEYNTDNEVDEYIYFYFYNNKLIKIAFYPYID